jgi:hypothetical protein
MKDEEWWKCTKKRVIKTGACWLTLAFTLVVSMLVVFSICKEMPFFEEDYVYYFPFNEILDVSSSAKHKV